jgi:hypothetical protein
MSTWVIRSDMAAGVGVGYIIILGWRRNLTQGPGFALERNNLRLFFDRFLSSKDLNPAQDFDCL